MSQNFTTRRNPYKYPLILVIILAVSLSAMISFGFKKEGYHVDELYSYGLSNSAYLPFMHFGLSGYDVKDWMNEYGAGEGIIDLCSNLIKDFCILKANGFDFYGSEIYEAYCIAQANSADTYTTTWVPGQDYLDYLAVAKDNTFNYASVYYNQRGDVHPPLFYMLLHTICSFFQGQFSKWFGLALNMAVLTAALVVLYQMCKKHFGGERMALAVVAFYAFSSGFMSTAMFIRMYALLTLCALLCTYVHLELLSKDFQFSRKQIIALFFSVFAGYYTQYYFVIYAIGMAAVCLVLMLLQKRWKSILIYVATLAGAAITGIIVWPFSIKHVFGGYRGQSSLEVLKTGSFYTYKTQHMIKHIIHYIFGGQAWLPVLVAVFGLAIVVLLKKKNFPTEKLSIVLLPMMLFTAVVGQISPFLSDRYVMCTYPFWCIAAMYIGYYGISEFLTYWGTKKNFHTSGYINISLLILTALFIGCSNYFLNEPGYLNPGGQETYTVRENTDCVFIIPDGSYNESSEELNILAQCDRVGVVYESNVDLLRDDYTYESGRYLLVEIIHHLDENTVLENVRKSLGVEALRELDRTYGGCAVRILLGE